MKKLAMNQLPKPCLVRKMDSGKTPYQRLLESPTLPQEDKDRLTEIKEGLNPIELRRKLTQKLRKFRHYLKDDFNMPYNGKDHDKV